MDDRTLVIVRGAGDLATGTIAKLVKSGYAVISLETEAPTAIRRTVAFSEAVYTVTSATFEKKKKKKYETVFGTFTYRNVPSEAFPLGIRLIQEGSRICGYNGA